MLWQPLVDLAVKLIEKVVGFFTAFFLGKGYERAKQQKERFKEIQRQNSELLNDLGRSDRDNVVRLRKRAEAKRKRKD